MEKILKYIFFILAMTGYLVIHAQDTAKQVIKNSPADKTISAPSHLPAPDLKLPPIPGVGQPGSDNPSKPSATMTDPKLPFREISGSQGSGGTNPTPPAEPQKDPRLNPDGTLPSSKEVIPLIKVESKKVTLPARGTKVQPAGAKPGNTTNYRNIKGPASQPTPSNQGKVLNYREIKGSKTQPAGEIPKR